MTWNPLEQRAMIPETAEPYAISFTPLSVEEDSSPFSFSFWSSLPTFKISAAARPSGYGRSLLTTMARRRGIVNRTPSDPPQEQSSNVCQNGNPCQYPIISRPGKMKIMADSVPAADACVCTMLFSRILECLNMCRIAIEITAAGMEDEKVKPTFSPRYTLDAVNMTVISIPRNMPRNVSSGNVVECVRSDCCFKNETPPLMNKYIIIAYVYIRTSIRFCQLKSILLQYFR